MNRKYKGSNYQEHYIEYTSFDKTKSISDGTHFLEFEYGPNQERRIATLYENGVVTKKMIYGSGFDKIIENNIETTIEYISNPSGIFAIRISGNPNVQEGIYYLLKDHLGFIVGIANSEGDCLIKYKYSAWGEREVATDNGSDEAVYLRTFHRGFTGHEHIDEFALINMNGRMYDPVLARFLSPDNYVQSPEFLQSLNRYSYCWNNPLVYNDPDGEWVNFVVGAAIGFAISYGTQVAVNYATENENPWTSIDWWDVAISTGAGALTCGWGSIEAVASTQLEKAAVIGGSALLSASVDFNPREIYGHQFEIVGVNKGGDEFAYDLIVGLATGALTANITSSLGNISVNNFGLGDVLKLSLEVGVDGIVDFSSGWSKNTYFNFGYPTYGLEIPYDQNIEIDHTDQDEYYLDFR